MSRQLFVFFQSGHCLVKKYFKKKLKKKISKQTKIYLNFKCSIFFYRRLTHDHFDQKTICIQILQNIEKFKKLLKKTFSNSENWAPEMIVSANKKNDMSFENVMNMSQRMYSLFYLLIQTN